MQFGMWFCSHTVDRQTVSGRHETGSATEPAQASFPLSNTHTPQTYTAKQSAALTPQVGKSNSGSSVLFPASSAGPASELSKQPGSARPALPASPGFQNPAPFQSLSAELTAVHLSQPSPQRSRRSCRCQPPEPRLKLAQATSHLCSNAVSNQALA